MSRAAGSTKTGHNPDTPGQPPNRAFFSRTRARLHLTGVAGLGFTSPMKASLRPERAHPFKPSGRVRQAMQRQESVCEAVQGKWTGGKEEETGYVGAGNPAGLGQWKLPSNPKQATQSRIVTPGTPTVCPKMGGNTARRLGLVSLPLSHFGKRHCGGLPRGCTFRPATSEPLTDLVSASSR